jgi:uncharacterized membrane protein
MYIAFKILHVFAVVVFLGNLITGILWKVSADQTRNPVIIHHTIAGLIRADGWFTIPAVLLILIGGFGAAVVGGLPLVRTKWILAGIILFTISGLSYMTRVVPIQRRMLAVTKAGVDSGSLDWKEYGALSRGWNVWGSIALVAPLLALIAMVAKP